jgi:hypothetical protein
MINCGIHVDWMPVVTTIVLWNKQETYQTWHQTPLGNVLYHLYTQNYWVFGLFTLSSILETRKDDVWETGYISIYRWGGKTPTQLGPLERANLNHWTTPVRITQHSMAMGSFQSPIVSNILMEHFEKLPLDLAQHKPLRWLQYTDDMFVVWPQGPERL